MDDNNQPKISPIEAFFLLTFAIIADLLNWVPVVNLLVTIITLPAYQIYFFLKGVRSGYSLAGNLIEFIPELSVIPAITLGVLITIMVDRAKASKLIGAALAKAPAAGKLIEKVAK